MSDMALLWHYIDGRIFRMFRHGNEKISFPSNTASTKDDVAILMKCTYVSSYVEPKQHANRLWDCIFLHQRVMGQIVRACLTGYQIFVGSQFQVFFSRSKKYRWAPVNSVFENNENTARDLSNIYIFFTKLLKFELISQISVNFVPY
jgi:hypothetical protein